MSLSAKIREQIINSFRAELAEHVQTMNDGLLVLEQNQVSAQERGPLLEEVFRAAHSLKGAARAIGVTAVEQLAHALEDVLSVVQGEEFVPTADLFTASYAALDAIQAVQAAYESGETTPPTQALRALTDLEPFRTPGKPPARHQSVEETLPVAGPELTAAPFSEESVAAAPVASVQPAVAPASPTRTAPDDTIRVAVSKLDGLMAQLSELLVTRMRAEQRRSQIREVQDFASEWQRDWSVVRSAYTRVLRKQREADTGGGQPTLDYDWQRLLRYLEEGQRRLRDLNMLVTSLLRDYDSDTAATSHVIDALEEEIKRVRLLPLHTITASFGRMIRDLAQSARKEVILQVVGADVELDKWVLEQLKDPLVHLLRNAIDHGIEPPAAREAAGKPRRGSVILRAEQLGKDVVITLSDDGGGLDIETIRRVAISRAESGHAGQPLSERELAEKIFDSGFTTSSMITDISGRGLGLDVVRRNIDMLDGTVSVRWEAGKGTVFTLKVPLTLTSARTLLVLVSGQTFAIPLKAVEHILAVAPDQIISVGGYDCVQYAGRPVTVVRMSDVLALSESTAAANYIPIVILTVGERHLGYMVDELVGEQEVVIKGLGKQLAHVCGIAGATVMGTGEVVLILNPGDLMRLTLQGQLHPVLREPAPGVTPEGASSLPRILIVDDSITTRTLEKNILEAAGYQVRLATDGEEALVEMAAHGLPDLIISDIAMPRLDGFGLTQRIRSDPRTARIPVILVTSLDSLEDKSRGIEVGADAYIVKSRFDQGNLLDTITQLI